MARNIKISKSEKESMKELVKINKIKRITELRSQIVELKKSPMIKSSLPLQTVLKNKIAELEVLTGEKYE
jgi:hypothetical protein